MSTSVVSSTIAIQPVFIEAAQKLFPETMVGAGLAGGGSALFSPNKPAYGDTFVGLAQSDVMLSDHFLLTYRPAATLSLTGQGGSAFFGSTSNEYFVGASGGVSGNSFVLTSNSTQTIDFTARFDTSATGTAPERIRSQNDSWSLESVREDYESARKPNWDGHGAKAITNEVLASASALFTSMLPLPIPSEVSPLSEGALSFVWELSTGYLFVSVGPRDILHVYYDVPAIGKWEQITSIHNDTARNQLESAIQHMIGVRSVTKNYTRPEPMTELLAA